MLQKDIGQRIAKLRGNQTQEELAAQLYITREKLSMWEQGRRQLKAQDLVDLANHFRVSVNSLLYDKPPEQMNIHHELGLSQAAIEALRQFKDNDLVPGTNESAGKCEALNKALSSSGLLNVLTSLMLVQRKEPGYYEASRLSDDGNFYIAELSPDSFITILLHRLQLIIHAIRTGDDSIFTSYAPNERMVEKFDSDPQNFSMLYRKKIAREQTMKELSALDKEIAELENEGAQDGKES